MAGGSVNLGAPGLGMGQLTASLHRCSIAKLRLTLPHNQPHNSESYISACPSFYFKIKQRKAESSA